jgi:hypothetical protein
MSYKIVDQIKKSPLPRPLKTVLEAYATFANRDGTSIRPTEAAVAERATSSRSVVSRHTQTLVATGLLVHDLDENGYWQKHVYKENGVWAYVYHIDASKLSDPVLREQWKARQNEIIMKRREAGAKNTKTKWAKGTSGNPNGHSKLLFRDAGVKKRRLELLAEHFLRLTGQNRESGSIDSVEIHYRRPSSVNLTTQ